MTLSKCALKQNYILLVNGLAVAQCLSSDRKMAEMVTHGLALSFRVNGLPAFLRASSQRVPVETLDANRAKLYHTIRMRSYSPAYQ